MKCVCGYEGEGVVIFTGREKSTDFEHHGIYGNGMACGLPLDGDLVSVFACPKCGTLKVDFDVNPLG